MTKAFQNIDGGFAIAHNTPGSMPVLQPGYLHAIMGSFAEEKDMIHLRTYSLTYSLTRLTHLLIQVFTYTKKRMTY